MAKFDLNVPVAQPDALVKVDVDRDTPLPIGPQRFRLVVVDDAGNESAATFLDVIVRDTDLPTAVLDVVNADGVRIDPVVSFGEPFMLSGARSSDLAPGKVVEYRFTLVDRA